MTTFAENNIVFPDGQLNVAPLPEALMRNGFTPETRDAPGMPLPAQYLNWLFRDVYRNQQANQDATNNALKKDANLSDIVDRDEALKNLELKEAAKRDVGNGENQIPDMSSFANSLQNNGWQKLPGGLIIQWGTTLVNSSGDAVINFPTAFKVACYAVIPVSGQTMSAAYAYTSVTKTSAVIPHYNTVTGTKSTGGSNTQWMAIGV
ncbi:hypothetical protein I2494_06590 [Budviciaceae bacterium BWR-B9]|uniref:Putative tail fiber protein gp53-like C-terminal domain-containing protein n=1 Tax=Limnobaculum allomyrinae TaxID=2791986 RepID=A0ABS1INQ4_9GAMM|nr:MULTISPECIES: hypothetical protein [Limnobaculum]MBK5143388.1 hypothetical protein [Limnobaculum allomyrinae]MBV7691276.1 hypothetical protein [Limnobaculum sp. M2-1]